MSIVQRVVPWGLGFYILLMVGLSIAGVGHLGFYDDEFIHLNKLQTFLDYGWYIVNDGPAGAAELTSTRGHLYVYGPLVMLLGHLASVAVGVETWGQVTAATDAFAVRHYVVIALSLVAVFGVGWTIRTVSRSTRWGLAAAAVLVSIPLWTGSAMYNIKDIGPAAGFTLLTGGLIAWALPADRITPTTHRAGWIALYFGTLLFWGIRPGLWPAIVLGFAALLAVRLRLSDFRQFGRAITQLWLPSSAVLASYLTMLAIYPRAFSNPIVLLYKSFADTSSFAKRRGSLTDGAMQSIPPSWDFLPKWANAQLPEVLTILALIASVVAVWLVVRRLVQRSPQSLDYAIPALVFAFMQFAAFPVAAIILHSRITSGLRQFLFVLPGLVMLVFVVLYIAVSRLDFLRHRRVRQIGVGLLVASTLLTTAVQFQLFPYVANYFTTTQFAQGIEGRWEIDRYRLSDAELYHSLSAAQRQACTNCSVEQFPDSFREPNDMNSEPVPAGSIITLNLHRKTGPGCTVVATVSRPYLWGSMYFAYANQCPADAVTP